jgi:RNA-binding protein 39
MNRETEPDWVSDLESDIKMECERFGHVEHIKVNSDSMVRKECVHYIYTY